MLYLILIVLVAGFVGGFLYLRAKHLSFAQGLSAIKADTGNLWHKLEADAKAADQKAVTEVKAGVSAVVNAAKKL